MATYYQLGGYNAHTFPWFEFDHSALARELSSDVSPFWTPEGDGNVVQLIFGIQRSGSSCLLMTDQQMRAWADALGWPPLSKPPFLSTKFESLSPISFYHIKHLKKTLAGYKPQSKKDRKTPGLIDSSQANRTYELARAEFGIPRGSFEHGRVFYRILRGLLEPRKFSLRHTDWVDNISIVSLAFNAFPLAVDGRSRQERLQDPRLKDIAWTKIEVPDLEIKDGVIHFLFDSARMVAPKTSHHRASMLPEVLDLDGIAYQLQAMLRHQRHQHLILLVWGLERTLYALKKLGIDTSTWQVGLKALLGIGTSPTNSPRSSSFRGRDFSESTTYPIARRRSRSPSPRGGPSREHLSRRRSPIPNALISVIDVQQMFLTLMQSNDDAIIGEAAKTMKVADDTEIGSLAGQQCHQLFMIWREMIAGRAIDDQRMVRRAAAMSPSAPGSASPPETARDYNSDEDPNDFEPITNANIRQASGYDDDYDDDVYYEDDDD